MLEYSDLLPAEQRVVEACAKGSIAEIPADGGDNGRVVRGLLIRQLLLKLPQGAAGLSVPFPVRLPGVRIRGAIIDGELDLRDCAGPGGEGLPALELVDCVIATAIDLSHARLARLSFSGSEFTSIVAHGVRIDGPFSFSNAGANLDNADAIASIDLAGAVIEGDVVGSGARLRRLRRDGILDPGSMRYALRISDAKIRGCMNLDKGFVAEGGVTISASHIAGEIWLARASLVAGESAALNARGAVVDGPVMMIDGFRAQGRVGFRGAEIKGDVSLGQERVSDVDGQSPRERSTIEGSLDLRGAVIEGSLEIGGSTLFCPGGWALNAAGVRIGDDVTAKPPPRHSGDPIKTVISGGMRLEGANVGGEVIWDGIAFSTSGPDDTLITLADARIGRALKPCLLTVDADLARRRPFIDLTGSHCTALDDDLERGWGPSSVRLLMDGFVYGRLERNHRGETKSGSTDRWKARRHWLKQRHEWWKGYHPQPYAHLARVYGEAGWVEDMRRVLRRQRTRHFRFEERWWMQPFVGIHWLVAGYGYAPQRAAASLAVYLLLGWVGVEFINSRGALVRDITWISSAPVIAPACGDEVSPPLYALDVAIPLLDLRQESECEPGAAPGSKLFVGVPLPFNNWSLFEEIAFWRWAKAAYAVLGAILTAIAVITFTGALRIRRDE